MKKMKKITGFAVLFFSLIILWAENGWSWCWIRDTGLQACSGGYQMSCCSGNLRVWQGASMTYRISTSTNSSLNSSIDQGFNAWNDIQMSGFNFLKGSSTTEWNITNDGINIVNIDSQFCTHFAADCGQGVLGFSGCWTTGSGTSYRAVECDIILNGQEYTWGDGSGGTINTVAVIAHESGHDAGLSHAGSTCRASGSAGCGAEFQSATMYWNYSYGSGSKATLEMDDVAALAYGYPTSSVRIQVLSGAAPVQGAAVELLDSAAPVNGSDIATGGTVKGDVTNSAVLFGDKISSSTYINSTPFNATDAGGYTNYINPLHSTFRVRVTYGSSSVTQTVTPAAGQSTVTVQIPGAVSCSGSVVNLQNVTFLSGQTYNCVATTSITAGTGVTVQSGATVTFQAPIINLQPGFTVESGAVFNARQ